MSDVNVGGGALAEFLQGAIGEGMSMTAARNAFREQGIGAMANQTFSQLYSEARFAAGKYDDWANLDYRVVPGGEQYATIRASGAERFLTRVEVGIREPGSRDLTVQFFTHMTNVAHTPQEAIDAANAQFSYDTESDSRYGKGTAVGAWVSGIFRTAVPL